MAVDRVGAKSSAPPVRRQPDATAQASGEESLREARERIDELAATCEARLRSEPSDVRWARHAEASVASGIAAGGFEGVTVHEVECRTSLCRLTIDFDDEQIRDGTFSDVLSHIPWDGIRFFRASDGDPRRIVVYAAREGRQLPGLG